MWTIREHIADHTLNPRPVDTIGVCALPLVILYLLGVQNHVVVSAPRCLWLDLPVLPGGRLIVVADEANHQCTTSSKMVLEPCTGVQL